MTDFPINDQRHSARQVTPSGLYVGNGDAEMRRLKDSGFPMPNNPVMARLEARKVASDLQSRGTVSDVQNRAAMAAMRQDRFRRAGSGGAMTRTAANTQMVLPKVRQPLGSLMDKGVPFNVHDPDELTELRRWCRLFYATHPLVPLLVDIYSKFPVMGLEFVCKDPEIEKFYTQMFMDDLNYEEFLPDGLLREYFMVGEVTALAHFNEDLGIWSSEEILNPDMVRVSKSLFVEQERVQLLVKDLVESLRTGPGGMALAGESPSEKYERSWEFQQLTKNYPEIISAAAQNDGLDISDALVSRMVNKAAWWDLRGTPHLLRSFRTLMLEESLNAAQDAVCIVAGQPILTDQGVENIEDVQTGSLVLTHQGRYRRVARTMVREADEPGVTLQWYYDRPLTLTGEHPVYVRRKVVRRGICAVCRTPIRDSHRGARRTVCDDHLASRVEPSGRLQRAVCCICGDKANAPKSNHCDLHDPDNQSYMEGFIRAAEVSAYDQVLHPDSPGEEKVTLNLWEHLDRSEWVSYDSEDPHLGLSGHDFFENAAYGTRYQMLRVLRAADVKQGDVVRKAALGSPVRPFPSEFKLTDDLLWLIGLHVADGHADSSGVRIMLGENEQHLVDRAVRTLRDSFGLDAAVRPAGNRSDGSAIRATNVQVYSQLVGVFFRAMCGAGKTKRFPSWVFTLSPEQTACLVGGWLDGDGTRDKEHVRGYAYQRHLQESVAWLIRRAGFVSTVHRDGHDRDHTGGNVGVIGCQSDNFADALCLPEMRSSVRQSAWPRRAYPADQGGYWAEVRSVDHHQVTATVYNLEVEEDHSYCAPIAVHNCDRLYAPMILATLGIENMGDGEPWIPDQAELEDLRDDIQSALAADFKLLCHNFGLNVTSVFGRESVPRFDTDYDRVDAQIMQSWGIGQGLIMGGSGDTYAGTAINREVCEQLMKSAQNKVVRHLRKRMEIVSEAQEFYDYDLKGGKRVPIYETVVEEDDETGEQYTVRVPKLLIPEVKFATLNLRDEATERNFVSQLKQLGVPISDKTLAINIPFEFEQELERQAQETIDKGLAQAEAMHVLQQMCDEQDYAYPPELTQHLMATLQLRQGLAQTEQLEDQTKMMDQQIAQASPAGMMGLLPGTTMQPLAGDAQQQSADQQPQAAPPAAGQQQVTATMHGPRAAGPSAFPPGGEVSSPGGSVEVIVPKNRQRPEESDEWRGSGELPGREPKEGSRRLPPVHLPGRGGASPRDIAKLANKLRGFKSGPSSYRRSYVADQSRVEQAIHRRAAAPVSVEKLVHDPGFYELLHAQGHEAEIVADWPEIVGGGAPESRKLLERLLEDYESITGTRPSRNF